MLITHQVFITTIIIIINHYYFSLSLKITSMLDDVLFPVVLCRYLEQTGTTECFEVRLMEASDGHATVLSSLVRIQVFGSRWRFVPVYLFTITCNVSLNTWIRRVIFLTEGLADDWINKQIGSDCSISQLFFCRSPCSLSCPRMKLYWKHETQLCTCRNNSWIKTFFWEYGCSWEANHSPEISYTIPGNCIVFRFGYRYPIHGNLVQFLKGDSPRGCSSLH